MLEAVVIGQDITVDANVLVWAFRYALGRRTSVPGDVAAALVQHGAALPAWQRKQITDEIETAIVSGRAGDMCDVQEWRRVQVEFARLEKGKM